MLPAALLDKAQALLRSLPEEAKEELSRRMTAELEKTGGGGVVWAPQEGPQRMAFESDADELLYGGAAGGGKTDLVLGVARVAHRSSLILRRTNPELETSVVIRSKEFYGDQRRYNSVKKVWWFPKEKRRVTFCHLHQESDVFNHKSAAYDFIGFDELTSFTLGMWMYMRSRLRTTVSGQRTRMIGATNPDGEGNPWVMRYWKPWIDSAGKNDPAGSLRWYVRVKGQDEELEVDGPGKYLDKNTGMWLKPRSRTFVPARLEDNSYLGEDYEAALQSLDDVRRDMLLHGNWRAGLVDRLDQLVKREWIRAAFERWRVLEAAYKIPGWAAIVGLDVSRGGSDKTVACHRNDAVVLRFEARPGSEVKDGISAAALVAPYMRDGVKAKVDGTGVGAAAYDALKKLDVEVEAVIGKERGRGKDRTGKVGFANRRAEMYWRLREALDPDGDMALALPEVEGLEDELCAIDYAMLSNGYQIQDKDAIRKKLGRSPDFADALALTFANDEADWAFPCVGEAHRASGTPVLEAMPRRENGWILRRAGAISEDCPGYLCRAIWHSLHGESSVVVVHVDDDGCWAVVDAWKDRGGLMVLADSMDARCRGKTFLVDLFTNQQGAFGKGDQWAIDDLWGHLPDSAAAPMWIDPARIGGSAGVDVLNDLLLSTAARWPGLAFWQGKGDVEKFALPQMLVSWDRPVLDELKASRFFDRADAGLSANEALIDGGGGYVRCLRMLAVVIGRNGMGSL